MSESAQAVPVPAPGVVAVEPKHTSKLLAILRTVAMTGGVQQVEDALTEMFYQKTQSMEALSIELLREILNVKNIAEFLADELAKARKAGDQEQIDFIDGAICDYSGDRVKLFPDGSAFHDGLELAGKMVFKPSTKKTAA
jgi:hypothetical protein